MNSSLLLPVPPNVEGQAKLILKGAGLGLLKPKFFNIDFQKVAVEQGTYIESSRYGYDKKGGLFGTPIWDTVTLQTPNFTDEKGQEQPSQKMTLDIALIEIRNIRNIVKTPVAGRNGTIKEYMSDGDSEVIIRGSLVSNYANLPPVAELEQLNFITSCPDTLVVYSNLLEYFRIFYLVVDEPKIKQRQGARNIIDFELICSSDIPIEIEDAQA